MGVNVIIGGNVYMGVNVMCGVNVYIIIFGLIWLSLVFVLLYSII